MNSAGATKFIVLCITILGLVSFVIGGLLVWKGFQGGELIAGGGSSAVTGLIGFLGGKMMTPAGTSGDPVKTQVTNTATDAVPTTETK